MPVPMKPYVRYCTKCLWFKLVQPTSDLMPVVGDVHTCPKCGNEDVGRVVAEAALGFGMLGAAVALAGGWLGRKR